MHEEIGLIVFECVTDTVCHAVSNVLDLPLMIKVNAWFDAMIYLRNRELFPLQLTLQQMQQ